MVGAQECRSQMHGPHRVGTRSQMSSYPTFVQPAGTPPTGAGCPGVLQAPDHLCGSPLDSFQHVCIFVLGVPELCIVFRMKSHQSRVAKSPLLTC